MLALTWDRVSATDGRRNAAHWRGGYNGRSLGAPASQERYPAASTLLPERSCPRAHSGVQRVLFGDECAQMCCLG